jgi:hypothetical protein
VVAIPGGMDSHRSSGSSADSPLAASAATSVRASGVIGWPATSGRRTRVHTAAGPGESAEPAVYRQSSARPYPQSARCGRNTESRSGSGGGRTAGVRAGGVGPVARYQTRATATARPSTVIRASVSEIRRPGRSTWTSTVSSRRGMAPRKSTDTRAARWPGSAVAPARCASSADGGPPCWDCASHGLSVARVGANLPSPSGR